MSDPRPSFQADQAAPAPLVLDAGGSVELRDPWRCLRIESGRVEIFALLDGGRRSFLAAMEPSALAFGGGGKRSLVLVMPEGGCLVPVGEATSEGSSDPFRAAALHAQTELWISRLSLGLAQHAPSRPVIAAVSAGETTQFGSGDAVTAGSGAVWVKALEPGTLSLMGVGRISDLPVPLTSATWVTLSTDGAIATIPTVAALRRPDWQPALAAFQAAIAATLSCWAAEADAAESARVAMREKQTDADLVAVHSRLGSVLLTGLPGGSAEQYDEDAAFVLGLVAPDIAAAPAMSVPAGIDDVLRAHGLRIREVSLRPGWHRADRGILIARRLSDGRPVVLIPDRQGSYRLHLRGNRPVRLTEALAEDLETRMLVPTAPLPNRPMTPVDVLRLGLRLCRIDVATLLLAGLLGALLGLLLPIATGSVVDTFIPSGLRGGVVELGLALAVLTVCGALLKLVGELARVRMDGRLAGTLPGALMDRVLRLPSSALRVYTSADLTQRVTAFESTRRTMTNSVLGTAVSGAFGLSSIVLLFVYHWPAGLVALGLLGLLLACAVAAGQAQVKALATGEALTASTSSLVLQYIQNISVLRAFGAERRAFALWATNVATMRARLLRARRYLHGFDGFLAAFDTLALAAIFAVLGFAGGDKLSIGSFLAFLSAYAGFQAASAGIARTTVLVLGLRPILKRVELLTTNVPETIPAAIDPGPLSGAVEVSQLSFAYSPDQPVLDSISLSVSPGAFVAIAGPSGSGKSTLVNLIVGLDTPSGGAVLFDGRDLAGLDRAAVRRQIGVVRQNGKLMGGSILDTILGPHGGGIEDAWTAVGHAGIAEDIAALPMGMHTVLSEGASTFSGGQVQRLLLARALVGRPRILILDEATSALDNTTQSVVTSRLDSLGMTRIVVAHRLSSIRHADLIVFMDKGRVLETGSFDELMASRGTFAAFAERQTL